MSVVSTWAPADTARQQWSRYTSPILNGEIVVSPRRASHQRFGGDALGVCLADDLIVRVHADEPPLTFMPDLSTLAHTVVAVWTDMQTPGFSARGSPSQLFTDTLAAAIARGAPCHRVPPETIHQSHHWFSKDDTKITLTSLALGMPGRPRHHFVFTHGPKTTEEWDEFDNLLATDRSTLMSQTEVNVLPYPRGINEWVPGTVKWVSLGPSQTRYACEGGHIFRQTDSRNAFNREGQKVSFLWSQGG